MDLSSRETRDYLQTESLDANPRRAFAYDGGSARSSFDWHVHGHHQLLYAPLGAVTVESLNRRYLLPPLHAALIPAEFSHRTAVGVNGKPAPSLSVFFGVEMGLNPGPEIHTFRPAPLVRELIHRVMEWGPVHQPGTLADSCFGTLVLLCAEACGDSLPFWLPRASDPGIARALEYVEQNLSHADEVGAARAAGMSERTFRRSFSRETGMTWRSYILKARMMRAADLLGSTGRSVADIAWEVGYRSASAFSSGFLAFAEHPPGAYRRAR